MKCYCNLKYILIFLILILVILYLTLFFEYINENINNENSKHKELKDNTESLIKSINFNETTVNFLDYFIINHNNKKKYHYTSFNLSFFKFNITSSSIINDGYTCNFVYDDMKQYFIDDKFSICNSDSFNFSNGCCSKTAITNTYHNGNSNGNNINDILFDCDYKAKCCQFYYQCVYNCLTSDLNLHDEELDKFKDLNYKFSICKKSCELSRYTILFRKKRKYCHYYNFVKDSLLLGKDSLNSNNNNNNNKNNDNSSNIVSNHNDTNDSNHSSNPLVRLIISK